jgi:hypothetical protein
MHFEGLSVELTFEGTSRQRSNDCPLKEHKDDNDW